MASKIPVGEMQDFKRPNHNDFATAQELRERKFSGIRHNSLSDEVEIWCLGNKERTVTKAEVAFNPLAINHAVAEVFALDEVMPDTPEVKAYIKERDSK